MDTAKGVYTVNLSEDRLEKIFYHDEKDRLAKGIALPCSYDACCRDYIQYVTAETKENYRIVDSSAQLIERFYAGQKQVTVEYQEKRLDGSKSWWQETVLMSQETVYDSKTEQTSKVVRGIILFKDTSEFHRQEEEEKERLQIAYEKADLASRAKTDFMNRMSHDIRTPINGILGMVQMIRKNYENQEKVKECVDKIDLSTNHLIELVNDVLDMSKIESGHLELQNEIFDLNELMEQVSVVVGAQLEEMEIVHKKHRENIRHTILVGDSLQIRRIMLNLFSNAIKYNKRGGRIDTYTKELSFDGENASYEFRIVDTGVGMSETYIKEELFKPFTQEANDARTQYKGTGLGMSIVKGLIEKMGGTIEADSKLGVGTEFIFWLQFPVPKTEEEELWKTEEDAEATVNEVPSEAKSKSLAGFSLLLVEDNEINMEIAEFYLTDAGASVTKAWNGKEAIELFTQEVPGTFDTILMDLMMPEMDGLEATRRIRAMQREDAAVIPILAMTAQSSLESVHECREAGMDEYIFKPVNEKDLVNVVLDVVG